MTGSGKLRSLALVGHCNLRVSDFSEIKSAVNEWWRQQSARFDDSSVSVLTSLSVGADQLAATALRAAAGPSRISLHAVLPYTADEYWRDVERGIEAVPGYPPEVASIFHGLNLTELNYGCQHSAPTDEEKTRGYVKAARHMADTAEVLLALWDGVYLGKPGGTHDSVRYALSAECRRKRSECRRPPLEVHWIVVPRASNPYPASEAFTWRQLTLPTDPDDKFSRRRNRGQRLLFSIAAALAVASFTCSFFGYALGYAPDALAPRLWRHIGDSALKAISHLTLGGLDAPIGRGLIGLVYLGRWLAVLLAISSIATIMTALFDQADALSLWLFKKSHRSYHLVCGIGRSGRRLITAGPQHTNPTIAVELRPDESTRATCAQRGVPLIEGDARDPELLRRVDITKVDCALITCGSDQGNMEVVQQLATLAPVDRRITCCVELKASASFTVLKESLPSDTMLDLRIFNTETVTARMLLDIYPIDRFYATPGAQGAEAVLIGDSSMIEAVLAHILQVGHFEGDKQLAVSRVTADAKAACRLFRATYPAFSGTESDAVAAPSKTWLRERVLPKVRFFDIGASERGLLDTLVDKEVFANGTWVTSVFVAYDDPAKTAAVVYAIGARLEHMRAQGHDITVMCYLNAEIDLSEHIAAALNRDFTMLPIIPFADFMGRSARDAARGDSIDRIAKRINGVYREFERFGFEERCAKEWPATSENDKDSCRLAAAHAPVKQRIRNRLALSVGGHARFNKLPVETRRPIELTLAQIEHRRWCAEELLKGVRPLTRIPSEHKDFYFALTEQESTDITDWFDTKKSSKRMFKRDRRHVDLVPLNDFKQLFETSRAEIEAKKDLAQIEALDRLLTELPAAAERTGSSDSDP